MLNTDYVRSQFPGLDTDWLLLDNAGGSQILKPVVDRINDHFYKCNVQLGGSYPHAVLAEERHAESHRMITKWLNARDPREIIMASSTTLLVNMLADNFGRVWKPGDEVIVTNCDHEANVGAWRRLADKGFVVKEWRVNEDTFTLQLDDLGKLITEKTRLVAFTAASNVLGMINPVKEITRFVHDRGAMVCVDAVAYMPHRLIDLQDTDVDFFVFSFYKTYGPHYAMMYGKLGLLEALPGNNHFFISDSPYKFQPGHYNFEICYGMGALPHYLLELADRNGYNGGDDLRRKFEFTNALIAEHEETLTKRVLSFLNSRSDIRIVGTTDYRKELRVPTISFIKKGVNSESVCLKTDKEKVAIRWGDFYARRLCDDFGFNKNNNGVVRISMVHYNTLEEADRLVAALEKAL